MVWTERIERKHILFELGSVEGDWLYKGKLWDLQIKQWHKEPDRSRGRRDEDRWGKTVLLTRCTVAASDGAFPTFQTTQAGMNAHPISLSSRTIIWWKCKPQHDVLKERWTFKHSLCPSFHHSDKLCFSLCIQRSFHSILTPKLTSKMNWKERKECFNEAVSHN